MSTIRAVVLNKPRELVMTEFPKPKLEPDAILLKVDAVGVCGSDKHVYLGNQKLNFPVILGHEFAGRVAEIGPKANESMRVIGGPVKEGDEVTVVPSSQVCGGCYYCLHMPQRPPLCMRRTVYGFTPSAKEPPHLMGAYAEYIYLHGRSWVYKLPRGVTTELASLCEPLAVASRAVERAFSPGLPYGGDGYGPGKKVVVLGVGPVGLLTVAVLKGISAGEIIAIDLSAERLDMAEKMGASHLIDASKTSFEARKERVLELCNGVGADVVVEAAGVPQVFAEGLELVRRGGKFIEVGHYTDPGKVEISPHLICNKDIDLHGSWAYPQIQFEEALEILRISELPFGELLTHKMPLEKAEAAIDQLGSPGTLKILLTP